MSPWFKWLCSCSRGEREIGNVHSIWSIQESLRVSVVQIALFLFSRREGEKLHPFNLVHRRFSPCLRGSNCSAAVLAERGREKTSIQSGRSGNLSVSPWFKWLCSCSSWRCSVRRRLILSFGTRFNENPATGLRAGRAGGCGRSAAARRGALLLPPAESCPRHRAGLSRAARAAVSQRDRAIPRR